MVDIICWGDVGGRSLRWYRDTFAPNHSYTELWTWTIARYSVQWRSISTPPIRRTQSTPRSDTRGAWLICLWHAHRADSCCTRGRCIQPAGSVGGNQRDNSRSSTLGNRWRSALQRVVTILADVLQTELITPKAEEGCWEQQSGNGGGWCVPKFRSCIQYCHRIAK